MMSSMALAKAGFNGSFAYRFEIEGQAGRWCVTTTVGPQGRAEKPGAAELQGVVVQHVDMAGRGGSQIIDNPVDNRRR